MIASRDVTENTPGPVITSLAAGVALGAVSNASRIAAMARCWPSVSEPEAASVPVTHRRVEKIEIVEEPAVPLDAEIDRFWVMAADLSDVRTTIERPPLDAAPIKRLGNFVVDVKLHHDVVAKVKITVEKEAEQA